MIIRKANIQDIDQIRHCVEEAYVGYIPRIGKRPASMDADFEPGIIDGLVWVIEVETKVVGLMVLIEIFDYFEIQSVAVLPAYQRMGFGRRLISYAEDLSLQKGCRTLRLYTNAALPELVKYYEALGYSEEKREYDHGFHRVFMVKQLI
jgi:ribosomal protein S18 acetylase RimI-like enzyme